MACQFLMLPRELRDQIYQRLFDDLPLHLAPKFASRLRSPVNTRPLSKCPPILTTCRQMYEEASEIFYQQCRFGLRFHHKHGALANSNFGPVEKNFHRIRKLDISCEGCKHSQTDANLAYTLSSWSTHGYCLKVLSLTILPDTMVRIVNERFLVSALSQMQVTEKIVFKIGKKPIDRWTLENIDTMDILPDFVDLIASSLGWRLSIVDLLDVSGDEQRYGIFVSYKIVLQPKHDL